MNVIDEKRVNPQIMCDYPAIVEGNDEDGRKFHEHACLSNLSASGLFMVINRRIENGSGLSITIFLTNDAIDSDTPKIVTRGYVIGSEPHEDGTCGIEVKFTSYHFQ